MDYTLKKSERLCSQLLVNKLFAGGNASKAVFPLRVVYGTVEKKKVQEGTERQGTGQDEEPPVKVLVSVPKKRFRHAVDRNRMKRMVRESYRVNKHILWEVMEGKEVQLVVAFICITEVMPSFHAVDRSVRKLLTCMAETVN